MAEVRLEQVTKVYSNGTLALRDVSLTIADGELLVVMGPSGCGKTTTLRLVAGLDEPTQGLIWIGGRCVNDWPAHRRDVAMIFQRPALYPHLSVRENLEFAERLNRRLDSKRLTEVVNILQLGDLLQRRPSELSGGQQQRVALGRAIVRQPSVFLLDEPLSNLDGALRTELRRELHLLHRRLRATMIYVTHEQAEALSLGERIAVLEGGVLQQVDRPEDLYARPANRKVAACVGVPGMNLLDGKLSVDGRASWFGQGKCRLPLPPDMGLVWAPFRGRPLTVGIRAENVRVAEKGESGALLSMEVSLIESLGDRTLVTLRNEEWTLTAGAEARMRLSFQESQSIKVELDVARTHLFDGVTGMALCHPESG